MASAMEQLEIIAPAPPPSVDCVTFIQQRDAALLEVARLNGLLSVATSTINNQTARINSSVNDLQAVLVTINTVITTLQG